MMNIIPSVTLRNADVLKSVPVDQLEQLDISAEEEMRIKLYVRKEETITRILAFTKQVRQLLSNHSEAERMVGWVEKEKRARRVLDGVASDADKQQLTIEASKRGFGETIEQLAQRQIELADILALQNAELDGLETKAIDSVQHAKDIAEVEALLEQFKTEAEESLKNIKTYGEA
ncbi:MULTISPECIES: hypothetical protein [Cysteiniphilum]|uniref:Uncharacterized protein n=1 Tax=Cysteiniphilum litorale TaxID=2056700 RepID=A0A8J2Z5N2_9GAMM|nr:MULTISPECIES: hypothetical protein [Cysteiniphilum]GGG02922.1 hypothetical protein GCM10010995_20450 [Cysteiniphilum litorale]